MAHLPRDGTGRAKDGTPADRAVRDGSLDVAESEPGHQLRPPLSTNNITAFRALRRVAFFLILSAVQFCTRAFRTPNLAVWVKSNAGQGSFFAPTQSFVSDVQTSPLGGNQDGAAAKISLHFQAEPTPRKRGAKPREDAKHSQAKSDWISIIWTGLSLTCGDAP